jgi:hypothetical protein
MIAIAFRCTQCIALYFRLQSPLDSRWQNTIMTITFAIGFAFAKCDNCNCIRERNRGGTNTTITRCGGPWNNGVDCAGDQHKAGKSIVFAVTAVRNKIATVLHPQTQSLLHYHTTIKYYGRGGGSRLMANDGMGLRRGSTKGRQINFICNCGCAKCDCDCNCIRERDRDYICQLE